MTILDSFIKIGILNLILIVWKSSPINVVKVVKKTIPYILGSLLYNLYVNPTDLEKISMSVVDVYSHRLIWEMIVLVYMS